MADLKSTMMDPKNKNTILVVGLAIVILAVIIIAAVAKNRPQEKTAENENSPSATSTEDIAASTSTEEAATPSKTTPTKKPVTKPAMQPAPGSEEVAVGVNIKANDAQYRNALEAYGGYRIQIEDCQPTPTKLTVKDGRNILLDGFSPDRQTIIIGSKKIVLNGYDAQVVRIDGVPQSTLSSDCERNGVPQYNIGEIIVMP